MNNWEARIDGKVRNTHRILITKLGGINPLGRPRHRWNDDKEI